CLGHAEQKKLRRSFIGADFPSNSRRFQLRATPLINSRHIQTPQPSVKYLTKVSQEESRSSRTLRSVRCTSQQRPSKLPRNPQGFPEKTSPERQPIQNGIPLYTSHGTIRLPQLSEQTQVQANFSLSCWKLVKLL
ncbi:MAG: hypothetical protein ACRC7W_05995, partial [Fusobacteriaceae bacterium]